MLENSALTAGDLMTRDVITVHPETSLRDAARMLMRSRIGGMPVIDADGAIIGILSEGDLVRWSEELGERQAWWLNMLADGFDLSPDFLAEIRSEHARVRAAMHKDVVSIPESLPAREVARLMADRHFKRLPVVRDGKLVGIVARADLVRALADTFQA